MGLLSALEKSFFCIVSYAEKWRHWYEMRSKLGLSMSPCCREARVFSCHLEVPVEGLDMALHLPLWMLQAETKLEETLSFRRFQKEVFDVASGYYGSCYRAWRDWWVFEIRLNWDFGWRTTEAVARSRLNFRNYYSMLIRSQNRR